MMLCTILVCWCNDMSDDTAEKLRDLLVKARSSIPENEFCGIGVVVYSDYNCLPVLPLCPAQSHIKGKTLVDKLIYASLFSNPCHDGFHLVSREFNLTHTNQYFAPPLPESMEILGPETVSRGARYVSAQIGSLLRCVCCTGVLSDRDGLVIFKNGREIE